MLKIIRIALFGSFFVSIIGVLEFTGVIEIEPVFAVSSTIGNSNYVGTYAVLLLPLAIALILIEKDKAKKLFHLLISFGAIFFLLAGSLSRAGYLAALVTIPVGFILLWKKIREQYLWFLSIALYSILILFVLNSISGGFLLEEIKSLNPFYAKKQEERLSFKDIRIFGTTAEIETDLWSLKISCNDGRFNFYNDRNEPLLHQHNPDNQAIEFVNEPYRDIIGYEYYDDDISWLMLDIEKKDIEFVLNRGRLWITGYNGQLTQITEVEACGFSKSESFASGRGYIWSRTLPLLKNAIFLGYGPDTFIYEFPQNDIVGKMNYGAIWAIISKPHSWYLQIATGSGVLSLIILLIFIFWYIASAFKKTKNLSAEYSSVTDDEADLSAASEENKLTSDVKLKHDQQIISAAILISVVGYCIAGIFNDSSVAVSPIFWMLLGFGLCLAK